MQVRRAVRATLILFPLLGMTNLLFFINPKVFYIFQSYQELYFTSYILHFPILSLIKELEHTGAPVCLHGRQLCPQVFTGAHFNKRKISIFSEIDQKFILPTLSNNDCANSNLRQ